MKRRLLFIVHVMYFEYIAVIKSQTQIFKNVYKRVFTKATELNIELKDKIAF